MLRRLACAIAVLVAACAPRLVVPVPTVPTVEVSAADRRQALLDAAQQSFARREEPPQLERALALWREAAVQEDSPELRLDLARAELFAAGSRTGPARRAAIERAVAESRRALSLSKIVPEAVCTTDDARAAPALYWLGEALDRWSRERGLLASVPQRREALCAAKRAAQLMPGYFHAGPLRLLGRLLAQGSALSGGDAEASRAAFDLAKALAPEFLDQRVDFAASWAVKVQDGASFDTALAEVLGAPADPAELGPENRRARTHAAHLKAARRDLFPK